MSKVGHNKQNDRAGIINADDRALLTVKEAALFLRISDNNAYELIRQGELPAIKLGKRVLRVPFWGLLRWIAREAHIDPPLPPVVDSKSHQH